MNNSSEFMDKQIMDLSCSASTDLIDLTKNEDQQKQRIGENGVEEMVPSYDFQPIRPTTAVGLSHSALDLAGSTTTSVDFESISNSPKKVFGSLHSIEPEKLVPDTTLLSQIDRAMKKHVDTLLLVMEGVTARLTQLDTRTQNLETLVRDLKVSVDNTHAGTDGDIRHLQNILVEVQSGMQLLKDKQDIVQVQLQLSKHHVSKVDQHTKTQSLHVHPTAISPAPAPMQQMPQFPLTSFPQPPSSAPVPSQSPSSQLLAQLPTQFSPQQEPYCPPPPSRSHLPPPNHLPYQAPQTQTPHQPRYQSLPQPPPLSSGYNPEEQSPYPMQSYPPNPPRQQPPSGSAPSQEFYNAAQPQPSMYDGAGGRSNSGFPSGYSSEPHPYTGLPTASAKPPHISSSGTGYPQLSNSRPLPHALPMNSAFSSGDSGSSSPRSESRVPTVTSSPRSESRVPTVTSSPRSESRVPIDDVIDRVTTMGFPRDQVKATVRKLTENGQVVDLNVVLDKLMNEGVILRFYSGLNSLIPL